MPQPDRDGYTDGVMRDFDQASGADKGEPRMSERTRRWLLQAGSATVATAVTLFAARRVDAAPPTVCGPSLCDPGTCNPVTCPPTAGCQPTCGPV